MGDLFYIIGIFYFLYTLMSVYDPAKRRNYMVDLSNRKKKNETPGESKESVFTREDKNWSLFMATYVIWMLLGLFVADQWQMFAIIFGNGWILAQFRKFDKDERSSYQIGITWVHGVITAAAIGYVIMNHFHHFDLLF